MTDEDKQELRALMLEVASAVAASIQKRMDEQFKLIGRQLVELQADTASCLDRLDRLEAEVTDFRKRVDARFDGVGARFDIVERRFDELELEVRELKLHHVKVSREQMRDRSRYDELSKRVDGVEREGRR